MFIYEQILFAFSLYLTIKAAQNVILLSAFDTEINMNGFNNQPTNPSISTNKLTTYQINK